MEKRCKYCGDSFNTTHQYKIICSKEECKKKYHHEKSYIKSTCPACNKEFEFRKCKPKKHCSKKCSMASPDVIAKMINSQKKTFMENYGVEHPRKLKSFKKDVIKKYDVESLIEKLSEELQNY